jgi:hypothetical protein
MDRGKEVLVMGHSHRFPAHGARPMPTSPSRLQQVGRFGLHFAEMCIPMCVGFMVGDAIYFVIAALVGYSQPFTDLPVLSVFVVTFNMTAPMVAWMRYRHHDRRMIVEMTTAMVVLAAAVLIAGAVGVIAESAMALAVHGLMMPAMLMPMLLHHDLYTGKNAAEASN